MINFSQNLIYKRIHFSLTIYINSVWQKSDNASEMAFHSIKSMKANKIWTYLLHSNADNKLFSWLNAFGCLCVYASGHGYFCVQCAFYVELWIVVFIVLSLFVRNDSGVAHFPLWNLFKLVILFRDVCWLGIPLNSTLCQRLI